MRIMRTARKLGLQTVAVYSDEDEGSLHTKFADEAFRIGPASSLDSYLRMDRIVEACKLSGADAVHPGYGFLSENTRFVELLQKNGITFVGPPAAAMNALGDKIHSKQLAQEAGVSCIPGHVGEIENDEQARRVADAIGYPIMMKASAGGGGKGMRIAHNQAEMLLGYKLAQREAEAAFGDGRLLFERYLEAPRHIEFQVLGDKHGTVLWLPERECSIQRRHQKVLEEAPSIALDADLRRRMGEQAVAMAKAAGYFSAGTIEFLLDSTGEFFFLEMNTRLQVEHSVTEDITGLDLVEQMLHVAAGEKLALTQEEASRINGWSVQCRICAEDPSRNFMPNAGQLSAYRRPKGAGIRVLSGVEKGAQVSRYYDSLISKVVTHAVDRPSAVALMRNALDNYVIRGVSTNVPWLRDLIGRPRFLRGDLSTAFIPLEYGDAASLKPANFKLTDTEEHEARVLAVLQHMERCLRLQPDMDLTDGCRLVVTPLVGEPVPVTVWKASSMLAPGSPVSTDPAYMHLELDFPNRSTLARMVQPVFEQGAYDYTCLLKYAEVDGELVCYQVLDDGPRRLALQLHGAERVMFVDPPFAAALHPHMNNAAAATSKNELLSPMCGVLVDVLVKPGQRVVAGEGLAVLQAMKMHNVLLAEEDCIVEHICVKPGTAVNTDEPIIKFLLDTSDATAAA